MKKLATEALVGRFGSAVFSTYLETHKVLARKALLQYLLSCLCMDQTIRREFRFLMVNSVICKGDYMNRHFLFI